MASKHVLIVFYRHHENHNNILEVFKNYFDKIPYIHVKDPLKICECYVVPAYSSIKRVLHYLDDSICNIDYFQWDIFEYHYNPFSNTHAYYALMLGGRTECGLIFSPRMEFTTDYLKKLEMLSED